MAKNTQAKLERVNLSRTKIALFIAERTFSKRTFSINKMRNNLESYWKYSEKKTSYVFARDIFSNKLANAYIV